MHIAVATQGPGCNTRSDILGEFVYAVTAAEGIILSSLFIGRNKDKMTPSAAVIA